MPNDESCASCKFFTPTPKGEKGSCRRMPPTPAGIVKTDATEWCGEFKVKTQEK